MLYVALVTVYVIICFFLILVVLLQQGKGADIAGAFGGGSSQTAFGARGATTFLHKLTTFAFVGFVLISMLLSIIEARPKASVIDKALPAAAAPQKPAAPAPAAPAPDGAAPAPAAAQPASGNAAQPSSGSPAKP